MDQVKGALVLASIMLAFSADARADGPVMDPTKDPAKASEEKGPIVRVSVDVVGRVEDEEMGVERRERNGSWSNVCELPCERRLDPDGVYRVWSSFRGVTPYFRVTNTERAQVRATFATPLFKILAVPLAISGITLTAVGASMLFSDGKFYVSEAEQPTAVKTIVGGTIAGFGLALLVGSGLMWFMLGKGDVKVSPSSDAPKPAALPPSPSQAKNGIRWTGAGISW
jgi:hypothetical protein